MRFNVVSTLVTIIRFKGGVPFRFIGSMASDIICSHICRFTEDTIQLYISLKRNWMATKSKNFEKRDPVTLLTTLGKSSIFAISHTACDF